MSEQLLSIYIFVDDVDIGLVDKILLETGDIRVIELHHGVYLVEGQILIFVDSIVHLDNAFDARFKVADFANVGAGISAEEVEKLIFIEYAGSFGQDELSNVNICVFVLWVDGPDRLTLQVVAVFTPHIFSR